VNGVATLGKLVTGVAPFNMATELARGVAPLVNGEIGGNSATQIITTATITAQKTDSECASVVLYFPQLMGIRYGLNSN
jgi:hypothetical protein